MRIENSQLGLSKYVHRSLSFCICIYTYMYFSDYLFPLLSVPICIYRRLHKSISVHISGFHYNPSYGSSLNPKHNHRSIDCWLVFVFAFNKLLPTPRCGRLPSTTLAHDNTACTRPTEETASVTSRRTYAKSGIESADYVHAKRYTSPSSS